MHDEKHTRTLSVALLSVKEQLEQPAGLFFSSMRWDVDPDDPLEQNAGEYFSEFWNEEQ